MHPEIGVKTTDATLFGRNYFNRPSAPATEDADEAAERAAILAEAAALKQSAVDYMHPEIGVSSASPECFGRNYFNRPSAPETEEDEFADERAEILAEMAALKQSAVDYMHPEIGVKTTDATLFGRNYFNRVSAPETEDASDAIEAARVLAEAAALKQSAVDYLHPEIGVTTTDATLFGRNYFSRPSATEQEDSEIDQERARVLAEAASLKKLAIDYLHPEKPVESSPECFGRNYFSRPSAPEQEDASEAAERATILAEMAALKKSAVDYLHPEKPVEVSPECFGRNYFTRYSSPLEYEHEIIGYKEEAEAVESPEESQDIAAVKNLAAAVKGANLPSTKTVKTSSADMDASAAKKSASSVNLFGLSEEVM
jgi:xylose isomerase